MKSLEVAFRELNIEKVLFEVDKQLAAGKEPLDIIEHCRKGMEEVGERYSRQEYFLGDLVMSAEIFKEVSKKLDPYLQQQNRKNLKINGTIVCGTVEGDIHDIGKNITISLLRCYGLDVIDLGVNVPPEVFIKTTRENNAPIICLSLLLSTSIKNMKRTIDMLKLSGIRYRSKVLIGGLVNERICQYVGADAWAKDAHDGVKLCLEWLNNITVPQQRSTLEQ